LLVHQHLAGENQRLGAFSRSRQSPIHEQFVESNFHARIVRRITTKVPAPAPVQSAEASSAESVTKILCRFSTEFSTEMLKTPATQEGDRASTTSSQQVPGRKKPPTQGGLAHVCGGIIPLLLPAASDRYRSWRERFARRRAPRALPSNGSWCRPRRLPA